MILEKQYCFKLQALQLKRPVQIALLQHQKRENGEEQGAKIGRLAVEDGVARATRRLMADTGMKVSETTVRSIRKQYVRMRIASSM